MKKTTKRLNLDATTVRDLTVDDLSRTAGGYSFQCITKNEDCLKSNATRCNWTSCHGTC